MGIAPNFTGRVVSQYQPGGYNNPAAIMDAIAHMAFGDVLLLEAQELDPVTGTGLWPVEIADATSIRLQGWRGPGQMSSRPARPARN